MLLVLFLFVLFVLFLFFLLFKLHLQRIFTKWHFGVWLEVCAQDYFVGAKSAFHCSFISFHLTFVVLSKCFVQSVCLLKILIACCFEILQVLQFVRKNIIVIASVRVFEFEVHFVLYDQLGRF